MNMMNGTMMNGPMSVGMMIACGVLFLLVLAVLVLGGNIVTAWSWFGVNELGIGLHSYGFTEGALMKLMCYVFVQCVIIGVGVIPLKFWWSYRADST